MRIIGKEYRVVCAKSANKQLIIDIAPADNALHRLILEERRQRDNEVEIIAGSVKLYDMGENNKPEIIFLPPENGGLSPVELSAAEENRLRYKIIARFNEMMAQNQQSTLTVRPDIHQKYVMDIINGMKKDVDALNTAEAPQSPAAEQNRIIAERKKHADRTRAQTQEYLRRRDEKYAKYNLTSLQIKQLLHRDY